jgi:hypothetical protein
LNRRTKLNQGLEDYDWSLLGLSCSEQSSMMQPIKYTKKNISEDFSLLIVEEAKAECDRAHFSWFTIF